MFATPDPFRLDQSPLGAYHPAPGSHIRRRHLLPEASFDGPGGVALSSTLIKSRAIPFVLAETRTVTWAMLLSLMWLTHRNRAASYGMLATPDPLRLGQSLPAASTPAPGPHTSVVQIFAHLSARVGFTELLRSLFSRRLGVS